MHKSFPDTERTRPNLKLRSCLGDLAAGLSGGYNIKADVKSGWSVGVYWNILAENTEKWR